MVKKIPQFGTKALIDSLHRVVLSIDERIHRIGIQSEFACRLLSWKFPEEKASSVDIPSILKRLQYHPKNDDANAFCHLFLLEIIIDRTLYFMFLHLIEQNPDYVASIFESQKVINAEPSTILDLYVAIPVKQLNIKTTLADPEVNQESLESKIAKKLIKKNLDRNSVAYQTQNWLKNLSLEPEKAVQKEVHDFQSQTAIENVPLDSNMLRSLLLEMVKTMEKLKLPSLVAKEVTAWEETSFEDQLEIISGIKVDTSRIVRLKENLESKLLRSGKQFELLDSKIQSLIDRIKDIGKKQQTLRSHFGQFVEMTKTSSGEIDRLFHEMANNQLLYGDELLKHKTQLALVNVQVANFKRSVLPLITNSVVTESSSLSVLANAFLQENNLKSQKITELTNEVTKHSAEISSISEKLETQKGRFCEVTKDLNERTKECQKAEDELDVTKEELEGEKKRSRELSEKLENIGKVTEKEEALRADLGRLKVELCAKDKLIEELRKKVLKLEDQCCLMAEYPDLNGPIEVTATNEERGLKQEMQDQIRANELRISLLHKQTEKLRVAACKLE
ncbi:hypothetical protein Ciccas_000710 [Cichlidogyrus casuarinus]|uniref:Uncharacterized protein n=1 Tax=Cichlidogyrus casuarinus TaxID=1844966 RepID=A0ABD2QN89_9PLAT